MSVTPNSRQSITRGRTHPRPARADGRSSREVGHWCAKEQVNADDSPIRPLADSAAQRETFIERIIEASARNKFLVFVFTIFAVAAGFYGLMHTPLDAIPDLSDVQVIVYTEWEGRSPDLVEDQITYPISTVFIAAPKVKFVRGESMFGNSFIYVIFE